MSNEDLEILRQFIEKALHQGWSLTNKKVEGTYVVRDPACIRVAIAKSSRLVDDDIYVDWLSPLHDASLAKSVWGDALVRPELEVAWRYHQHRLLDLLQTAGQHAYFEYLSLAQ